MKQGGVSEIMLETEFDNYAALSLYESLGFIREKRLYRFYLNGKDAFRLILVVPPPPIDSDDSSGSEGSSPPSNSSMLMYQRQRLRAPPYRAIPVIPYSDDEDEVSSR
ncbi:hypothetical protein D9611_000926 [Ephemerocybe angulata]|nr:hypothetical protein D9611_000926 [Tulosesus angulatus]